jgi:hypothetical protein
VVFVKVVVFVVMVEVLFTGIVEVVFVKVVVFVVMVEVVFVKVVVFVVMVEGIVVETVVLLVVTILTTTDTGAEATFADALSVTCSSKFHVPIVDSVPVDSVGSEDVVQLNGPPRSPYEPVAGGSWSH